MERQDYEAQLARPGAGGGQAETFWDGKAAAFNAAQQAETSPFVGRVTEFLQGQGLLSGASVLDVGGGSGRYALAFAKQAAAVTVTDISAQMLAFAKANAEQAGLQNLTCRKLDWAQADLAAEGLVGQFDLTFAAMCPALYVPAGLRNLCAASRGHSTVAQFIADTDTASDALQKQLGLPRGWDPHNDRAMVQTLFNLLWLDGKEPQLTYLHERANEVLTLPQAVQRYGHWYGEAARQQGHSLQQLLQAIATGDTVQADTHTTLALLWWRN